MNTCIWRNIN